MNNRSLHSILEGLGDGSIASIQEVLLGMQIHEHPDMIASAKKFHSDAFKWRDQRMKRRAPHEVLRCDPLPLLGVR
jgi:hypothetical protein